MKMPKSPGLSYSAQSCKLRTRTDILVDLQTFADQLDFGVGVLGNSGKTLLNALNLLRNRGQDALLETIELVEATPSTDLAETNEDTPHRLKVKRLVAAEDQNEATQLNSQRFDRLGFA